MTVQFHLPDVGEGLHEAEIVRWLVRSGERVSRDQPLVEILTDKAQVELPSPVAGVIGRLGPAEGSVVPVGTLLVEIDDGGTGTASTVAAPAGNAVAPPAVTGPAGDVRPAPAEPVAPGHATPSLRTGRPKASPSTRRLAARLGVALELVAGSGPGGRILTADVEAAAAPPAPAAPHLPSPPAPSTPAGAAASGAGNAPVAASRSAGLPLEPPAGGARAPLAAGLGRLTPGTHPLRGIRRLTAAAMTASWSNIPHITGMDEVDATALLDARGRLRQALQARGQQAEAAALTPLVLLATAVARALRRFPLVNATVSDDATTVTVHQHVDLGIAVATDDGLIVPVVRHADLLEPGALALEMQRLADAARHRTIGAAELRGGTFTITNYGALGGRFATPLILPGQAGIMGFGAIRERPIAVDGAVQARPALPVVFSADHRIIDGDLMVAFQESVLGYVADPLTLLLGG